MSKLIQPPKGTRDFLPEEMILRRKVMETIRECFALYGFVENQLSAALNSIKGRNISSLIVAYEPVWAIGTGMCIKADDGEAMHDFIYDYLKTGFSIGELRVIYGGSVTEANIEELIGKPHIDGVLVGGASLDPQSFYNIFKLAVK